MAKFVIINKDKPDIIVKSFNCNINKLCAVASFYNNVLYHNGDNRLPVEGDLIYKLNNLNMQYELFINNSAAINDFSIVSNALKYIKTDDFGKCQIIICS